VVSALQVDDSVWFASLEVRHMGHAAPRLRRRRIVSISPSELAIGVPEAAISARSSSA
jgi:hypothetical protein